MDSNNTTQYSPLNNLSSGEEVEQFTLPVNVNVHKPKRRRKRREFDSLKAQNIIAHKTGGVCKLSTCVITFTFILLVAGVCGLSVLVYRLYIKVHELQHGFATLKLGDGSHHSSIEVLMSRLDDEELDIATVEANLQTINQTVKSLRTDLGDLNTSLNNLNKKQAEKSKSTDVEQLKPLQRQLAQFGSDFTSMQKDVATLKQQELSNEARLGDLDAKLMTTVGMSEDREHKETADQVIDLQQKVQSVNKTLSARVDSMNGLIQRAYINYTTLDSRLSTLDSTLNTRLDLLDQEFLLVNGTTQQDIAQMNEGDPVDGQSSVVSSDGLVALTERVDTLEYSLREIYLRQQDKLTTLTENQVVNLTIAGGMEDIISRVIDQELETIYDQVANISNHSTSLDDEVAQLDGRFTELKQQIPNLVALRDRVDSLESSLRELYLKQEDKMATLTENQVVNLTIARGMEDIISRVIDQQLEGIYDRMDNVSHHSASLDLQLLQFDTKFNSLSSQIATLVKLVNTVADSNTNFTSLTSNSTATDNPAVSEITQQPNITDAIDIDDNNSQTPTQSSVLLDKNSDYDVNTDVPATPSLAELLSSDSPH